MELTVSNSNLYYVAERSWMQWKLLDIVFVASIFSTSWNQEENDPFLTWDLNKHSLHLLHNWPHAPGQHLQGLQTPCLGSLWIPSIPWTLSNALRTLKNSEFKALDWKTSLFMKPLTPITSSTQTPVTIAPSRTSSSPRSPPSTKLSNRYQSPLVSQLIMILMQFPRTSSSSFYLNISNWTWIPMLKILKLIETHRRRIWWCIQCCKIVWVREKLFSAFLPLIYAVLVW